MLLETRKWAHATLPSVNTSHTHWVWLFVIHFDRYCHEISILRIKHAWYQSQIDVFNLFIVLFFGIELLNVHNLHFLKGLKYWICKGVRRADLWNRAWGQSTLASGVLAKWALGWVNRRRLGITVRIHTHRCVRTQKCLAGGGMFFKCVLWSEQRNYYYFN